MAKTTTEHYRARYLIGVTLMPRHLSENSDLWHIVNSLQKEAGGGVAKAVQITCFFDANGRLIGKTDCKTVRIMPGNAAALVSLLFANGDK